MKNGTLLIPDTGPDFLRSLNLAAIYSDTVHTFTFTNQTTVDTIDSLLAKLMFAGVFSAIHGSGDEGDPSTGLDFDDNEEEPEDTAYEDVLAFQSRTNVLRLAEQEGVLYSIGETAFTRISRDNKSANVFAEELLSVVKDIDVSSVRSRAKPVLNDAMSECPPSINNLFAEALVVALDAGSLIGIDKIKSIEEMLGHERELLQTVAFGTYMVLASHYAVANGLTPVTWQSNLDSIITALMSGIRSGKTGEDLIGSRRRTTHRLGELVLDELVPNVADLPFESILEIRRRRKDEVRAFQSGLAEVAADIDPELGPDSLELELDTKIQAVFKPALRDLNRATQEIQIEAYRKLLEPDKETAMTLVPMVVSLGMGAPVEISAASGAFAVLAKLYEFTVGKRVDQHKILKASPWSLLFCLEQAGHGTSDRP